MARHVRKKIMWNDGVKARHENLRLPNLVHEVPYNGRKDFQLGKLFSILTNMEVMEFPRNVRPHEFRYVFETWMNPGAPGSPTKIFKLGSLAVYAGPVRVDEIDSRGHTISCLRHSFIIEGGRYMTTNLNHFMQM